MCLRKSASCQICVSLRRAPNAGIPVKRMPCATFQNVVPLRIVLDAVFGQLRRLLIETLRDVGRRRVGSAVTDGAVCRVELDAGDQIVVVERQRIGRFRRLAGERRVQRPGRRPALYVRRFRIGIGRHDAGQDPEIGA